MQMNVSASKIFCNPTWEGFCGMNNLDLLLKKHIHTREYYTMEECYGFCLELKECFGFLLKNSNKACYLFRKGCTRKQNAEWKYYSMDDCRFGINS